MAFDKLSRQSQNPLPYNGTRRSRPMERWEERGCAGDAKRRHFDVGLNVSGARAIGSDDIDRMRCSVRSKSIQVILGKKILSTARISYPLDVKVLSIIRDGCSTRCVDVLWDALGTTELC